MLLYLPESVYRLDRAAVEIDGYSEIELMQRAGQRVWRELRARWPDTTRITLFAGSGNNGGDAFVVALCALREGLEVQMLTCGDLSRQSDTARHFADRWREAGGSCEDWQGQPIEGEVIVDGLLGIGIDRPLDERWQSLIGAINAAPAARLAIDIPSGLNGATGIPQPVAVQASMTVTFIGAKTGQWLADGPDFCGDLVFDDLGMSDGARDGIEAQLEIVDSCRLPPPRKKNSHKNDYGNLLVIGGDRGMSGAVSLAARAALRSGAGLVTALVHPDCRGDLAAFAEIMVSGWDALEAKLARADVVIVGPGLGDGAAARECLHRLAQAQDKTMVIDASALTAPFLRSLGKAERVITPHPGEAARLLASSSAEVQADRMAAAAALAEQYSTTCVLKGSGTLIAHGGQRSAINTRGNPGMASAGMGDVLSGIVGALLGQGLSSFDAARSAVYLHALAADDYCDGHDPIGLIASDIIERIPAVIHRLRSTTC